mmetsp:Transcript_31385/g.51171  ORF Transcript_31385/g.51171 Transcript_31385/m.51171 type:complete len:231 (-) Transcript_31385:144-836(-)
MHKAPGSIPMTTILVGKTGLLLLLLSSEKKKSSSLLIGCRHKHGVRSGVAIIKTRSIVIISTRRRRSIVISSTTCCSCCCSRKRAKKSRASFYSFSIIPQNKSIFAEGLFFPNHGIVPPTLGHFLHSSVMGFSLRGLFGPLIPAFRFQPGRQLGDLARCIARPARLVRRRRVYLTAAGSIFFILFFGRIGMRFGFPFGFLLCRWDLTLLQSIFEVSLANRLSAIATVILR